MKTSVAVGIVFAALGACVPSGGTSTTDTEGSSSTSSGGAETTIEDPSNGPDTGPIQTVTSDTDPDPTGSTTADSDDTTTTTGDDPSTGEACGAGLDALADALAGARCELLLGFDGDGVLTGWHSVCGPAPGGETFTEKDALGATSCCGDGGFLNVPDMNDVIESPFVVFLAPADPMNGGVAIVSNHLGAVVFDASIGIGAPGMISVPDAWSPAAGLADPGDCSTASFDFPALASYHAGDGNNEPDIATTLAAAIEATLLPDALVQAGTSVERSVLLGYEDHAGAATRYIVLLELTAA